MRSILPLSRDSPRLLEAPHDALAKHVFGDLAHAEAKLRAVLPPALVARIDVDKFTYRVTWSEEDGEFVGLCSEFPALSWLAKTRAKALAGVEKLAAEVVRDMHARGEAVPEPIATRTFSGSFKVRIPRDLHRKPALEAAENAVSLNRLVSMKLAG